METNATSLLPKVMDLLVDAICVVDAEGQYVFVSAASERIFGYSPTEMLGRRMIDLVHPDDRESTLAQARAIMAGAGEQHFENRYLRKDGRVVHIMWSARWSPEDGLRIAVARDITARKHAESIQAALYGISEAAHAAADMLGLFEKIHRIIGRLLPAENFFVALYDEQRDQLSFPYFVDAHDPRPDPRPLDSGTLSARIIRSGQPLLLRSDESEQLNDEVHAILDALPPGHPPLEWLGVPLRTHTGVIGVLAVQSYSGDVSYRNEDLQLLQFVSAQVASAIERKQVETQLTHLARHDQLTGLPNRALFRQRLDSALVTAARDQQRLSLLYIDLDRFKDVNDTHGHTAGDGLLCEVAQRIRACVRESDTVARVGGDEFVVLLQRMIQHDHAIAVAEKIRAELNRPFELEGLTLRISSSIGVVMYPDHGARDELLVKLADEAMYDAKKSGGNRLRMSTATPPAMRNADDPTHTDQG